MAGEGPNDQYGKYPDVTAILARKAEWRQRRGALGFAEKLTVLDALKDRMAPVVRARDARRRGDGRA